MTNLGQIPSNMTRAGIGNIAPKSDLPGGYTEPYRFAHTVRLQRGGGNRRYGCLKRVTSPAEPLT